MVAKREEEFYTVSEAARILKVSPSTIWRWVSDGRLPAYRAGVRTIRIRPDELARFMRPVHPTEPEQRQAASPAQIPDSIPIRTDLDIEPLTDEEVERALEALARARELREEMRARRGGRQLASSLPLIHEARAKRSRSLR